MKKNRYIRSDRGDLHDPNYGLTGQEYLSMLARGLNREQAVGLLAAKAGVNRPAIYHRLRAQGALPPYKKREAYHVRVMSTDLTESQILARRVDRTPCARCGVRADIGCGHKPARYLSGAVFG